MTLQQRVRRDQNRHTDDWLITYADTITLLLCLFVITLAIKTGAKPATPAAPTMPTTAQDSGVWGPPGIPSFTSIAEPTAGAGSQAMTAPAPETRVAETEVAAPHRQAPRQISTAAEAEAQTVAMDRPALPAALRSEPARPSLPEVVDRLASRGTPIVAQSGDRITTLQIGSAAFFSSGSAALSNAGKAILSEVADTLESPRFAAYHITIEGHTDDTPINTPQFQSNWELSAQRASAVVRFLLDLGLPAGKLTASGYADTVPIAPNRNADGTVIPDNQARNRRVAIRLEKIDKSEQ